MNTQAPLPVATFRRLPGLAGALAAGVMLAAPAELATPSFRFVLSPADGSFQLADARSDVSWRSSPFRAHFGEAVVRIDGRPRRWELAGCEVSSTGKRLEAVFRHESAPADRWLRVGFEAAERGEALAISYEAAPGLAVDSVRLLDDALWVTDAEAGAVLVPVREGLWIPADSGLTFQQRFSTYAYEGCHQAMVGVLKRGTAALVSWSDPYVAADVRSAVTNLAGVSGKQVLALSLELRKSARAIRIQLLGRGDHNTIAQAYRKVAEAKGWRVPWTSKLRGHPGRARYFGASNFKLWSLLDRRMNEDSSKEESVRVNWTFNEAAQVAEHLRRDLEMERVLFILGGWIHRGYDNQHPDILPAAPECGGDAGLAECSRRVRALGYLFCLHDNYQDIYRDSPSWNERWIMKHPDGSLVKGGHWAGGVCYLTCSQMALELARRPENLPAVRRLTGADSYFIDTTYAAGLQECYDPQHPLTYADDMRWKQAISDYARELFGSFGSECGREWAVPHADFFEGLTGVSGGYYHDANLTARLGAVVVPLFELVYGDCIALYGKYGYDPARAADYVLHHVLIGRPLHYHNVPPHLYWKSGSGAPEPLALRVRAADVVSAGPRQFRITYEWAVGKAVPQNWRVFVHFTDRTRTIRFQNDHDPSAPTSQWPVGIVRQGPFTVAVPPGVDGTFDVRVGLFQPSDGARAVFFGAQNDDRSCRIGRLEVADDRVTFEPAPEAATETAGDPALFLRGDHGWTAGLHSFDRFVKNTHEILSPLNELTAAVGMTRHEFVTPDRMVQRSVFGEGKSAVRVVTHRGFGDWTVRSELGGEVRLPSGGFLVESPTFVAFYATRWGAHDYPDGALFTLRSMDGRTLSKSRQVRIYHGFGSDELAFRGETLRVPRQAVWRR